MVRSWKKARPWLLARLPELEKLGWDRSKLFRAGKLTFPFGNWGIAWYSIWSRPEILVKLEDDGSIRWSWKELDGKLVSQAARPNH